jgi:hypothetical protein
MRRGSSPSFPVHFFFVSLTAFLLANSSVYGQSLGDVARENREQKATQTPTTPPKVITNATLPKDPEGSAPTVNQAPERTGPSTATVASSRKAAQQRAAEQRAAAQWKQKILAQESTIANLRLRVDRLKASIHFVEPNNYYPYDSYSSYAGMAQNQYQARQLERLAQMRLQLNQQKKKLEDMQEAARHAGMHTAVYDP